MGQLAFSQRSDVTSLGLWTILTLLKYPALSLEQRSSCRRWRVTCEAVIKANLEARQGRVCSSPQKAHLDWRSPRAPAWVPASPAWGLIESLHSLGLSHGLWTDLDI